MTTTAEQRKAIEDKYQAELVKPYISKNYDASRYAARAKIERDHALAALDGADPAANDAAKAKALQDEFDASNPNAMGGGDLSLHFNEHPFSEGAYQAARPVSVTAVAQAAAQTERELAAEERNAEERARYA